jgi:23S rRNA (uracil1939-C5)-methyltransferase
MVDEFRSAAVDLMAVKHAAEHDLQMRATRARIEGLSSDGRGIARRYGKTIFIEGALPGEDVGFHINRQRRGYDEAFILEIHEKSNERVVPACRHFGVCGGCVLQHLTPAAQLKLKQSILLDTLERIGRVHPQTVLAPISGPVWGYRRRARLSVRKAHSPEHLRVGFVELHGGHVVAVRRRETLNPKVGNLMELLSALIGAMSIGNRIPQIEVAIGEKATVPVLRTLAQLGDTDRRKLLEFELTHDVHIYIQLGYESSAAPLNGKTVRLNYTLSRWNVQIDFEPTDFIQVNGEINQHLILRAIEQLQVEPQTRVLDLFCGLGNFTLPLARMAREVVGVEGEPRLVKQSRKNAVLNNMKNVKFYQENLFADQNGISWLQTSYDRLLLDPPRAGARGLFAWLGAKLPPRIVYVSCHPATLARDAGFLVHERKYELVSAGIVDMFPHTAHIESMAMFTSARSHE